MPPTRQTTKQIPEPSIRSRRPTFDFPTGCHLVITTPRHVFAWDQSGVRSLFRSRRSSIVAAREAKDGSGVLAIASGNVVVLHDTKRGKDDSWGLNAEQEEVRHLEYAPDAKSLFLTTTSDGTVQRYDVESARMLDPVEKLPPAPVAMAVSPTAHIVLSASLDPPVVYVKNLAHNTVSSTLHPNASSAPVSCAVFHPERPNIFLLAFRDGTVAAYDATKMPKRDPDQSSAKDGEISHIKALHRAVATGDASLDKSTLAAPIAGAAFLPGYKTRAVTAGRDGKCKIVDFANKGVLLRSWHVRAPLTSISVFPIKPDSGRSGRSSRRSQTSSTHTIGGPTTTDSLIALGRVDGKVHIYDTVGLLLAQKAVSAQEERIISVEWAKGNTPRGIDLGGVERHFSDAVSTSLRPAGTKSSAKSQVVPTTQMQAMPASISPRTTLMTPALLPPSATVNDPPRKFTHHPDEVDNEAGTVRHIPFPKAPAIPVAATYDDLFSPIKTCQATTMGSPQKRVLSPGRNRPRLSSQTFIKGPQPKTDLATDDVVVPRNTTRLSTIDSHATSSDSGMKCKKSRPAKVLTSAQNTSLEVAPSSPRPISFAEPALRIGDGTASRSSTAVPPSNFNAQVLADLRKLNGSKAPAQHGYGTLSAYTAPHRVGGVLGHPPAASKSGATKRGSVHLSNSDTWPTDSAASSFVVADNDIWLTSDAEDDITQQRKRRKERHPKPGPARQTTGLQVDHSGNANTASLTHALSIAPGHARHVDGTTEEEVLSAETHMSPAMPFPPASEDLRGLFPRSSSLSPHRTRVTNLRPIESPNRRGLGMTAIALNEALGRNPKSPWARAKAGRRVPSPHKTLQGARKNPSENLLTTRQVVAVDGGLARSPSYKCLICPEITARMQILEGEVAMMKGEVLAMKALLRRNGLPFPTCLR